MENFLVGLERVFSRVKRDIKGNFGDNAKIDYIFEDRALIYVLFNVQTVDGEKNDKTEHYILNYSHRSLMERGLWKLVEKEGVLVYEEQK